MAASISSALNTSDIVWTRAVTRTLCLTSALFVALSSQETRAERRRQGEASIVQPAVPKLETPPLWTAPTDRRLQETESGEGSGCNECFCSFILTFNLPAVIFCF